MGKGEGWGRGLVGAARKLSIARTEYEANVRHDDELAAHLHGVSVFHRAPDGRVFHTYSSYARGADILLGAYNYLDLTPKGRDEDGLAFTMGWVRHHDRYGDRRVEPAPSPAPSSDASRSRCAAGRPGRPAERLTRS